MACTSRAGKSARRRERRGAGWARTDATQAAARQPSQKDGPESLDLRGADVQARRLAPSVGATSRRLPPHSPEFSPIEMAFATLKALLRAAAARTIPDLWQAIAEARRRFTPRECANCLAAAGYHAT